MGITLRLNKGSALTYQEMDENLSQYFYSSSLHDNGNTLRLHYTGSSALDAPYSSSRYVEVPLNTGSLNITNNADNRVLTATGTDTINGESTLTYDGTILKVSGSLVQGLGTDTNIGFRSHTEGNATQAPGLLAHAEGENSVAAGDRSHAEGTFTSASGFAAHSEGWETLAQGYGAHAEGQLTRATGLCAHTEGFRTTGSGDRSHAEGQSTVAEGDMSHAEGRLTVAKGYGSHAEGYGNTSSGSYSHVEGEFTTATGDFAHAEGRFVTASGNCSHAEGNWTVTQGDYQHVQGMFNALRSEQGAFIVGAGTSDSTRKNLIYASGSLLEISGSLNVSASIKLNPQTVLPVTFEEGTLTASGSNLYYCTGSAHIPLINTEVSSSLTVVSGSLYNVSGSLYNVSSSLYTVSGSLYSVSSSLTSIQPYIPVQKGFIGNIDIGSITFPSTSGNITVINLTVPAPGVSRVNLNFTPALPNLSYYVQYWLQYDDITTIGTFPTLVGRISGSDGLEFSLCEGAGAGVQNCTIRYQIVPN